MEAWEGGGSGGGAVTIPTEGFTLSSGKTTVEFGATVYDEAAAVTVATSDGTAFVFSRVSIGPAYRSNSPPHGRRRRGGRGSGALSYRKTKDALEDEDEPNAERII